MSFSSRAAAGAGPVEQYAAAAERFAEAVRTSDMRAVVRGCPGWSTYDLVVHLGNVHAWAATIVETGQPAVVTPDEPASGRPDAVTEWYAAKAEDLCEVLRLAAPEDPCWNFAFGTGVASFWSRRQLLETSVHQVDLDLAAGRTTPLAAPLCADGIDEVLSVFLHRMHARGFPCSLDAPLSLVSTDTDQVWTLLPHPDRPPAVVVRPEPAADSIAAPASLLFRLLWKRVSVDDPAIATAGDPDRIVAFLDSRLTP